MASPTPPTDPGQTTPTETPPPSDDAASGSVLTQTDDTPVIELFDPDKFEVPADLNKDHETYKQFVEYAKEIGMPKAQAEKLVGIHAAAVKATQEAMLGQWKDQQTAWIEEIKKDPEIGNTAQVRQVFGAVADNPTFSDPKFKEALDFTGAGNHPAVVRTLFRWAKALSEGASVGGDPVKRDAQGNVVRPTAAEAMYPGGPHSGGPNLRS